MVSGAIGLLAVGRCKSNGECTAHDGPKEVLDDRLPERVDREPRAVLGSAGLHHGTTTDRARLAGPTVERKVLGET